MKKTETRVKGQRIIAYTGNPDEDLFGALAIYKDLIHTPNRNVFHTLKKWREAFDQLLKYLYFQSEVAAGLKFELALLKEGVKDADYANSGKPWDENEDVWIVDSRADGMRVEEMAKVLLRSPFAVATRLSQLVGVTRSIEVERQIDGVLNGDKVSGLFEGTMRKVT